MPDEQEQQPESGPMSPPAVPSEAAEQTLDDSSAPSADGSPALSAGNSPTPIAGNSPSDSEAAHADEAGTPSTDTPTSASSEDVSTTDQSAPTPSPDTPAIQVPQSATHVQIPDSNPLAATLPTAPSFMKELLSKANAALGARRQKKLEKIAVLARTKGKVTNREVCETLHVSITTAGRYLDRLTASGRLKRSAGGRDTFYEPTGF